MIIDIFFQQVSLLCLVDSYYLFLWFVLLQIVEMMFQVVYEQLVSGFMVKFWIFYGFSFVVRKRLDWYDVEKGC